LVLAPFVAELKPVGQVIPNQLLNYTTKKHEINDSELCSPKYQNYMSIAFVKHIEVSGGSVLGIIIRYFIRIKK
jgi:hypothetical protein